jgi:ATP-binding cassette subfamily B protein
MTREFKEALQYVVRYRRRLAVVLALSILSTVFSLVLPYLSRSLVDRAFGQRDLQALYRIVEIFAVTSFAGFIVSTYVGLLYTRVSADMLFDMRLALYTHLQRLSPRFYARVATGEILARVNNDVGEIQRVVSESLLALVGNVLFLVGSVAAMFWLDTRLAFIALALVPVSVWLLAIIRRRLAVRVKRVRETSADVGSFLVETLQAMRLVVTANAQEREAERFRDRNRSFVSALMRMQLWSYLTGGVPTLVWSIGHTAVFIIGGRGVVDGTLSLGTFIAFMAYQMRLMQPAHALMSLWANLATVQVSLRRVQELLSTPPDVTDPAEPVRLPNPRGAFEFRHVSVDLGGRPILRDVSFCVEPGEVVAIVGATGSGKSTLADLLLRFADPDTGLVLFDGEDMRALSLSDLRCHVMLVEQEPIAFNTTILENIRYSSPKATPTEVRAAARAAGLDDFVMGLPLGYETIVGQRGYLLSAGERQRMAIARTILAKPVVLVLDEPSASLDPLAEQTVVAAYVGAAQPRDQTVVVITHRYTVAMAATRVIVLEDNRIVQDGAPADLIVRDGAFAKLFVSEHTHRLAHAPVGAVFTVSAARESLRES